MSATPCWPSRLTPGPALHGRITITPGDDGHVHEIAVERAMRGDAVSVTFRELVTAYQRLTDAGASLKYITTVLGLDDRTVARWRHHMPAYASDLAAAS